MSLYLDTSCLLKLFFPERESARVAALVIDRTLGQSPYEIAETSSNVFAVAAVQIAPFGRSVHCRTLDRLHLATMEALGLRRVLTSASHQDVYCVKMDRVTQTQTQDPLLEEIVKRLVHACRPERIYLFGSRARGDGGDNSDYDIMVVVSASDEPAYRRAQRAHSLLWDLGAAADILVWTHEAFESRMHLRASLPATITREGGLLYAA